jgi:hypothetical protein
MKTRTQAKIRILEAVHGTAADLHSAEGQGTSQKKHEIKGGRAGKGSGRWESQISELSRFDNSQNIEMNFFCF